MAFCNVFGENEKRLSKRKEKSKSKSQFIKREEDSIPSRKRYIQYIPIRMYSKHNLFQKLYCLH